MIPRLSAVPAPPPLYQQFLQALASRGFKGEISSNYGDRTVLSTDNSIYQVLPQAVLFPKDVGDLIKLAELSQQPQFRPVKLTPRGGGTGTNGQSLTDGVVVDTSRHMNKVLEINQSQRWARVQCGVVKDQLNAALKPFGLFFAPELSTSNRATVGGMINTDASGQGSCLYGKTRDHVLELTTVLLDGSVLHTHPLDDETLDARCDQQDRVGLVHRLVNNIDKEHKALIDAKFPKLNRCLTGYDLAHIRDGAGRFDLNSILCGSEGTLGFIAEAKLNLVPIPKHAALVVVQYSDFNAALRDAARLMQAKPSSIETVDSKVLNLAMKDIVWQDVAEFFPRGGGAVQAINLVEYTADADAELRANVARLQATLTEQPNSSCLGHSLAWGDAAVKRIWGMRKKAVGLLGNSQGEARPVPFVEDTAVPPEHLADFIEEFRALLDSYNLSYGMFGHVDAGVLHVRPALDMKDPAQEAMVRVISDAVAALTQKYNGLLWGEHGKGVRSEYAPKFFGELYPQLQRIKAAFDPYNQLNPGKIATPDAGLQLLKIDEVPTRGQQDRQIPVQVWQGYQEAVHCNGNGACYNWAPNDAMCPSWKVTRERVHSPKGRATLTREWIRQMSGQGFDTAAALQTPQSTWQWLLDTPKRRRNSQGLARGEYDFSHEVHQAMMGCLACKSCAGQCPVKVDVPTFRSRFLSLYYTRYSRPLKDYLVGSLETVLPLAARMPAVYNAIMGAKPVRSILSRWVGFEDAPMLSKTTLANALNSGALELATPALLQRLTRDEKPLTPVIVQDAFTSFYETQLLIDLTHLLRKLGFRPLLAPFQANGKPLHVHGFLHRFAKVARRNAESLRAIESCGVPLIGVDPAMTLTFRNEYVKALGDGAVPKVHLPQEWLASQLARLAAQKSQFNTGGAFKLLPHCTEKTTAAAAIGDWQKIFAALGQTLEIVAVGCCGMSGTYGHESEHRQTSSQLFDMSWRGPVTASADQGRVAASGYSCRSQCSREAFAKVPHPLQLLLQQAKA